MVARRYVHSEPTSRLATLALRTAWFALAATFLAVIIVRSGILEIKPALATFAGALAIALIALLLAFAAFVVIWMEGLAGMRAALGAMMISLLLLGYPAYLSTRLYRLPWINDITTDPIDPPRYEVLAPLRGGDANPATYAGLHVAEQQRHAYPDIGPLATNASVQNAYRAAYLVLSKHKDSLLAPYWKVMAAREPIPGRRDGRIEAIAFSSVLGFRDDVVVRVRAEPDGARIDARSSSRYGEFDFGVNASRIRRLMNDIEDAIRVQRPERPPGPPPTKKTGPAAKEQAKRQ
ncbi:MAG: DUF1499 domain-containing protein [Xanthobacteraceae bacterium]